MKKFLYMVLVLVLLVGLLPSAAMAKAPTLIKVDVYNRTGGQASLTLTKADGSLSYFTLIEGWSQISLEEGRYPYYVTTNCGPLGGNINLTVSRKLVINCDAGPSAGFKAKPSSSYCLIGVLVHDTSYFGIPYGNWFYPFNDHPVGYEEFFNRIETGWSYDAGWIVTVETSCWDGLMPLDNVWF